MLLAINNKNANLTFFTKQSQIASKDSSDNLTLVRWPHCRNSLSVLDQRILRTTPFAVNRNAALSGKCHSSIHIFHICL